MHSRFVRAHGEVTPHRKPETAERELLEWKKIAYIRERVGDPFDAVVTGVAPFGLFVQLTENLVEGLLRAERLGADAFEHVPERQELRGRRTGETFRLGQRLRVVVERVDTVLRRVDLSLEGVEGAPGEIPPRESAGRRGAGKTTSKASKKTVARRKTRRR